MFDYTIAGGLPAGGRAVWSNLPLHSLAQGILTPFSYSTLAEIIGRAWYKYFDALDFEPMPRARIMRQLNGLPYLNLTLSAQRDAEQVAIEPITLQINGQAFPVTKWEKPGLLAGIKFGLKERKVAPLLAKLEQEIDGHTVKLSEWYGKVKEYRWTQADILLVMEEIEPLGSEPMVGWFAAQHNLDRLTNRLLRASQTKALFPANLSVLKQAIGPINGLIQIEMHDHRCQNEGELFNPRQEEMPIDTRPTSAASTFAGIDGAEQALLNAVDASQRKSAQEWLQQIRRLLLLQSKAQYAFSYVLAATRRWAKAAEHEAMVDKRIAQTGDVFFYELEEVKQMMTGEWNISDAKEIQATAQKRKAEYARWQASEPVELLIGDSPAQAKEIGDW